jgi:hypothetical protein
MWNGERVLHLRSFLYVAFRFGFRFGLVHRLRHILHWAVCIAASDQASPIKVFTIMQLPIYLL